MTSLLGPVLAKTQRITREGGSWETTTYDILPSACPSLPGLPPTDGDIRGAVGLQEAVEVMPDLRDPVDDFHQLCIAHPPTDLRFHELPPQEAAKETLHGLRVVGTKHPPGRVKECLSTPRMPNKISKPQKP